MLNLYNLGPWFWTPIFFIYQFGYELLIRRKEINKEIIEKKAKEYRKENNIDDNKKIVLVNSRGNFWLITLLQAVSALSMTIVFNLWFFSPLAAPILFIIYYFFYINALENKDKENLIYESSTYFLMNLPFVLMGIIYFWGVF